MRFYVVCDAVDPEDGWCILAEDVRDAADTRELSLASTIAGARSRVQTRLELLGSQDGRVALGQWDRRDDTLFDHDQSMLAQISRRSARARLHTVDDDKHPVVCTPTTL